MVATIYYRGKTVLLTAVALLPSLERRNALVAAAEAAGRKDADAAVAARREELAKPAAEFAMRSLDGETVSLSGLRGKVVVLSFWFPT